MEECAGKRCSECDRRVQCVLAVSSVSGAERDDSPAEQTTTKHSGVLACSVYKLRAVSRGPAASRLTAAHSPGTVSSGNFRAASGNRLWLSPSFLTFKA